MLYLLVYVLYCFVPAGASDQEGKLEVMPTKAPDVFNIIYKGDMKWNVSITLYNEKGKKRFEHQIPDTDGFILPISLKNEKSGTYQVEVFTPVYDLHKEFHYLSATDLLASLLEVSFNKSSRTITVSSEENIDQAFHVYIMNESGDQLVFDDVEPLGGKITRIYNLRGAPASSLQFVVLVEGSQIIRQVFE